MAERPSEEEIDDDTLIKLLMQRMTTLPSRAQTQSRSTPRVQTSTPADGNTIRRDLTDDFNRALREDYKNKPSRGQYFDQSPDSKDFERIRQVTEDAPRKVKKIDPNQPEHESRRLHREMRARSKGGQMMNEQQMRDYIRMVEEGYRAGGGRVSVRTMAERAAKSAVRRTPLGLAAVAGYKAGSALSPAARRNRERAANREVFESRQERLREAYPGKDDAFYLNMARQMMREDEEGYAPNQRSLEEVIRLMELEREQEQIRRRR